MKQLDTYYKALLEYQKIADSDAECESFLRAWIEAEADSERIELNQTVCTVEEDWIEEIERGLEHIAGAIRQERQFILSEGEVLPIEKVKSVSAESVRHLAKHSNLISRAPTDGEIIPDAIYTVERLNDYTVYENRFLYMLLCYLRDFISVRLERIVALSHPYTGSFSLHKALDLGGRRVSCSIDLTDENKNDPYLRDHHPNKEIIDRISLLFSTVLSLLSTPLMEAVSKAPMLTPPITKTNVLEMDKHFKGAVDLYDYIMAYNKPGYITEEKTQVISPFDKDLSRDVAGICAALQFVTYTNALGIKENLAHRFKLEQEKERAEQFRRYTDQLAEMKRRLQDNEIAPEEYVLDLEKKFEALTRAYAATEALSEKLGAAEEEIHSLREHTAVLDRQNKALEDALEFEAIRFAQEKEAYQSELDQKLTQAEKAFSINLRDAESAHERELDSTKTAMQEEILRLRQQLEQAAQEHDALKEEHAALREENLIVHARLKSAMLENGGLEEAFTDKERFDRLEREYEAFTRFYKRQWKQTKKEIRKSLLNYAALKGRKNDDE